MFRDQRFDLFAAFRRDVRDDHVLIGGEAEIAVVDLGHAREPGEQLQTSGNVPDPAVLDEQGEMRAAVLALGPAVAVAGREKSECARLIEAPADAPLDL